MAVEAAAAVVDVAEGMGIVVEVEAMEEEAMTAATAAVTVNGDGHLSVTSSRGRSFYS